MVQEVVREVEYDIVIEETGNGFSAYVTELPGCVAAAATYEETRRLIREAIDIHEDEIPVPEPQATVSILA